MSEYTPGPWTAGREERELKGDPDDPWVVYGFSLQIDIASSNDEADARLIAAAPDQHDALKVMTAAIRSYLVEVARAPNNREPEAIDAAARALIEALPIGDAAIAKATGE